MHPLLHRWFVQYNPVYILSATLVLGGTFLASRGLAEADVTYGSLATVAVAELYAFALLAGAALLKRIGHRRAAVMLGLLVVLYQPDLTLFTETAPRLGTAGAIAAGGWLALFWAKLVLLGKVFELTFSRAAIAAAMLGGFGLLLVPAAMASALAPSTVGAIVASWVFGLVSLQARAEVTTSADLDAWGQIVLRRSVRATWMLWATLGSLHVVFWSTHGNLDLGWLVPAVPLIAARWVGRERRLWLVVGATLAATALLAPAAFSGTAAIAAALLLLRAHAATRVRPEEAAELSPPAPYRDAVGDAPAKTFTERDVAGARRLFIGASTALYFSMWTASWAGGPWPAHVLALDLCFAAVASATFVRTRGAASLLPSLFTWLHFAHSAGLLPIPASPLEWGASAIGLGFLLLIASLAASYRASRIDRGPSGVLPTSPPAS